MKKHDARSCAHGRAARPVSRARNSDRDAIAPPIFTVIAHGASEDACITLRARGYRWNGSARAWELKLPSRLSEAEEFWLAANVYGPDANPTALGPGWMKAD